VSSRDHCARKSALFILFIDRGSELHDGALASSAGRRQWTPVMTPVDSPSTKQRDRPKSPCRTAAEDRELHDFHQCSQHRILLHLPKPSLPSRYVKRSGPVLQHIAAMAYCAFTRPFVAGILRKPLVTCGARRRRVSKQKFQQEAGPFWLVSVLGSRRPA
jgi:hypothetical protein